jgi:5-methylcytosine-specific restriction enzyme A
MGKFVDKEKLLELFKITLKTLQTMEKKGLPFTKIGKTKLYDINKVEVWLKEQKQGIKGLDVGKTYSNEQITKAFKCGSRGGMRRAHITMSLVLFTDETIDDYPDEWVTDDKGEDILNYCGQGREKDMDIEYLQNKTLFHSRDNNVEIYLCETLNNGGHVFLGQVELVGDPFTKIHCGRIVWMFPLRLVESNKKGKNLNRKIK